MSEESYDVIIVGGSYAGLSAALTLGRSLRRVLILDKGEPCNRYTPHSHNFLTRDGQDPAEITKWAVSDVLKYDTVELVNDLAATVTSLGKGFSVATQSGRSFASQKLILATGLKDLFPDIEGFVECWGKSVVHCPYCHGYEGRGKPTGILANGWVAMHYAPLVKNLTSQLTIFTNGKPDFSEDEVALLGRNNISIDDRVIESIKHDDGQIKSLMFEGGKERSIEVLYAGIPFEINGDLHTQLGCEVDDRGLIKVDFSQKTNVADVYACGDNSGMRSLSKAVAAGTMAGSMINFELSNAEFQTVEQGQETK